MSATQNVWAWALLFTLLVLYTFSPSSSLRHYLTTHLDNGKNPKAQDASCNLDTSLVSSCRTSVEDSFSGEVEIMLAKCVSASLHWLRLRESNDWMAFPGMYRANVEAVLYRAWKLPFTSEGTTCFHSRESWHGKHSSVVTYILIQ